MYFYNSGFQGHLFPHSATQYLKANGGEGANVDAVINIAAGARLRILIRSQLTGSRCSGNVGTSLIRMNFEVLWNVGIVREVRSLLEVFFLTFIYRWNIALKVVAGVDGLCILVVVEIVVAVVDYIVVAVVHIAVVVVVVIILFLNVLLLGTI